MILCTVEIYRQAFSLHFHAVAFPDGISLPDTAGAGVVPFDPTAFAISICVAECEDITY